MISQISAKMLAAKLEAGEPVYLVDVRQPMEHEHVALPGSVLVPLGELHRRLAEIRSPDDALVVVYCHHGIRSMAGAQILQNAGFSSVASLTGGIDAWSVEVDPALPRY
jgi:rhodanese-related sulfurtransferase